MSSRCVGPLRICQMHGRPPPQRTRNRCSANSERDVDSTASAAAAARTAHTYNDSRMNTVLLPAGKQHTFHHYFVFRRGFEMRKPTSQQALLANSVAVWKPPQIGCLAIRTFCYAGSADDWAGSANAFKCPLLVISAIRARMLVASTSIDGHLQLPIGDCNLTLDLVRTADEKVYF